MFDPFRTVRELLSFIAECLFFVLMIGVIYLLITLVFPSMAGMKGY